MSFFKTSSWFFLAKVNWANAFFWLASFFIVGFGQPAWSPVVSIGASFFGYALFWKAIAKVDSKKKRFLHGAVWFALAEAIHLSWMTATRYHGFYILVVYLAVLIWMGSQFGVLCACMKKEISFFHVCALASFWTLLEYSRLFVLCGFIFNPVGLALSSYPILAVSASVVGVYGLSFLVIFINLLAYKFLQAPIFRNVRNYTVIVVLLLACGISHVFFHKKWAKETGQHIEVALVQTGLKPEQKIPMRGQEEEFISPFYQWTNVFSFLECKVTKALNLIVLPEASVPFGAKEYIYMLDDVKFVLKTQLVQDYESYFPSLIEPFAKKNEEGDWQVSNSFWLQTLANFYTCEVLAGLDDYDKDIRKGYNAAFFYSSFEPDKICRYEKRKLVPLAEYLPIKSLEALVAKYGITGFAEHGKKAIIFGKKIRYSPSICYEECFPQMMKEGKEMKADVYVNLTNDGWFYPSKLPRQHLYHARVRAIENGVAILRSCNTGVTAGINSLGEIVGSLEDDKKNHQDIQDVLMLSLNYYNYPTIYTQLGDYLIVSLSFLFLLSAALSRRGAVFNFKRIKEKNIPS